VSFWVQSENRMEYYIVKSMRPGDVATQCGDARRAGRDRRRWSTRRGGAACGEFSLRYTVPGGHFERSAARMRRFGRLYLKVAR
jgi:hypothetical protein